MLTRMPYHLKFSKDRTRQPPTNLRNPACLFFKHYPLKQTNIGPDVTCAILDLKTPFTNQQMIKYR
ncbi:hypothetical protein DPMN_097437 [Dreissena polymorpha]|nr:hypothetical protein DPMN_097437 [Dreissena polymorpha]